MADEASQTPTPTTGADTGLGSFLDAPSPVSGAPADSPSSPPAGAPEARGSIGGTTQASPPGDQQGAPAPGTNAAPAATTGEPATSPPPTTQAPALELKLPQGMAPESVGWFTKLAPELGLDGPKAQKLVDAFAASSAAAQKQAQEAMQAAVAKENAEWRRAIANDPDIGGKQFREAQLDAVRFLQSLPGNTGQALAAYLKATGQIDQPHLAKAFALAGRRLREDSVAGTASGSPNGPGSSDASPQQRWASALYKE